MKSRDIRTMRTRWLHHPSVELGLTKPTIGSKRCNIPIPKGYRIFYQEFEVAGVEYSADNLGKVLAARTVNFYLEPEPANLHDANAIKIVAIIQGILWAKRRHIGYVPREIEAKMANRGAKRYLTLRLKNTGIGDRGGLSVTMDILGPKSIYTEFFVREA